MAYGCADPLHPTHLAFFASPKANKRWRQLSDPMLGFSMDTLTFPILAHECTHYSQWLLTELTPRTILKRLNRRKGEYDKLNAPMLRNEAQSQIVESTMAGIVDKLSQLPGEPHKRIRLGQWAPDGSLITDLRPF